MGERKDVRRSVAVGLGILSVVLIAGLIGAIAYYTMAVNDKNATYDNYISNHSHNNSDYDNYVAGHHHFDSDYDALTAYKNHLETWLAGNITELQGQISWWKSVADLAQQQTILNRHTVNQGASARSNVAGFQANYAGYVQISLTSTTSNAYITLEYWYQGRFFSFQKTLGTSGEAFFCVLPSSVAIYVGNSNWLNGATHTITATYHY